MKRSLLTVILLIAATCNHATAKSAGNQPYVATFEEQNGFYAKCIPAGNTGSEGTTQVMCLRPEGDELVTKYSWYNRYGLVMGWSPKEGKVAVMRMRQDEGLAAEKQIEFSFYLGDRLLRSYTTADLVKLGAKVERDMNAIESGLDASSKRAVYHVEGCKQVSNTNDYYFRVRLDETHALSFDILTGELCRIENDGGKERLVQVQTQPSPAAAKSVLKHEEVRMLATNFKTEWIKQNPDEADVIAPSTIREVKATDTGWHVIFERVTYPGQPEGESHHFLHVYMDSKGKLEKVVRGPDKIA
ncbi:MAG: hypothetical protein C0404_02430 [Verrucomicrobia bacterium]|nr:hypothetical protein [Verrucomicrobiota bacterium]